MANISLLPHNEEAYQKLMQHFASHDRAAVVHATGTGKSYIIASVVGHFYPSAIVIAPNNFVLEETKKICPPWVTFRTYASLMYDTDPAQYNIIVLDEFHRAGAEEWGKGVQRLIQANPTAKLLGTSATHIRYLDNARNMADELFDGNIVSSITIGDAINRGILPNPIYVSSLYEINETLDIYTQRISNVRINDETKEELLTRMRMATSSWDQAYGVPNIIRKYYTKDMQRIIVFCSKVERSAHFRSLIAGWLSKAGYKHVRFYSIDYTEKRLESEMADFQAPMGNYDLKVAMSVNMLNEGVHIPHVDGIIMLRGTISRNIIEQQIGRCLTANAKHTPVILDLVNNMDTIRYDWQGFYAGDDESSQGSSSTEKKDTERFPFLVIDEMRDLRIFFNQIDSIISIKHWDYESCKEEALKYSKRSEFERMCGSAYNYALRKGILDDICSHMPKQRLWDYESCKAEALKYSSMTDFCRNSSGAYDYALRKGILKEICSHFVNKNGKVRTREELSELASRYSDFKLFREECKKEYNYIRTKGWTDIYSHMKKIKGKTITREYAELAVQKYKTLAELRNNEPSVYCSILRNGWNELFSNLERAQCNHYSEEDIYEIASKYTSLYDFKNEQPAALAASYRKGIYSKIRLLIVGKKKHWDYDSCKEEALKYTKRIEFRRMCCSAYSYALREGILDDICSHMPKQRLWDYESCKAEALKYSSRHEFSRRGGGAYNYARKQNIIDELFPPKK